MDAKVSTTIHAAPRAIWDALVKPELISRYMFGAKVKSDFRVGSPITWSGEWKGKPYEDRGTIRRVVPERLLEYDHYSPLTGPDVPENHHEVTIRLRPRGDDVEVELVQDNNPTDEARAHSEQNWRTMLDGLKKVVEHPH